MTVKLSIQDEKKIKDLFADGQKKINDARQNNNMHVLQEAEDIFLTILNVTPNNSSALFFLGCIHLIRENDGFAETLFSIVYKSDKNFVNCANNLGIIYKNREERKKASSILLEAIHTLETDGENIYPDQQTRDETLADLYSNLGSCFTNNGTPELAIQYYEKSLSLKDKKDRDTPRFNMALAYLELNDFKNAWPNYKYYSIVHPDRRKKNYHQGGKITPKWEGDKSQILAVLGEQGIGDELMFASMFPLVMEDMRVIFDCHPRLENMFRRAFPEMPIYGTRKDPYSTWNEVAQPDAYIPIAELAEYYLMDESKFSGKPYITADEKLFPLLPEKIREKSKKLKIGFSWTGGLLKTNSAMRTIPPEQLARLLGCDCEFYSLQYKKEDNENLKRLIVDANLKDIHIHQDVLDDYDLTACMLEHLDFIMCAPQSVIFLAGAMGVETYQLCPKRGMWQQGKYGTDMVWFNSVKNIWQPDFGDWESVIDEAIKVINDKINK